MYYGISGSKPHTRALWVPFIDVNVDLKNFQQSWQLYPHAHGHAPRCSTNLHFGGLAAQLKFVQIHGQFGRWASSHPLLARLILKPEIPRFHSALHDTLLSLLAPIMHDALAFTYNGRALSLLNFIIFIGLKFGVTILLFLTFTILMPRLDLIRTNAVYFRGSEKVVDDFRPVRTLTTLRSLAMCTKRTKDARTRDML